MALQQERKLDMLADVGCQRGTGKNMMWPMSQKYKKPLGFIKKIKYSCT